MSFLARANKSTQARLVRLNKSSWRPLLSTRSIAYKPGQSFWASTPRALQGTKPSTIPHKFYTTESKMANVPTELTKTLTPSLLEEIRTFWFNHINDEESLILPAQSEMQRWFTRDMEFDKACVTQFQPALEAILASNATPSQILAAVDTSCPLTWLSLVLLLDQIPRNCYRGPDSKLVFQHFDPLASAIALQALDSGVVHQPQIRYKLSYRFWFCLPLMHSESLDVHKRAVGVHEETARDMEEFLELERDSLDDGGRKCHDVLFQRKEAMRGWLGHTLDFEKRHLVIIERFGRYPHRNEAMGRVPTKEEVDYLENGGETFG